MGCSTIAIRSLGHDTYMAIIVRYCGCGGRSSDLRPRTTLPTGGMAVWLAPDLPVGAAELYGQRDVNSAVWPISD